MSQIYSMESPIDTKLDQQCGARTWVRLRRAHSHLPNYRKVKVS